MLEAALARKDQLEWELSNSGGLAFQSRLASIAHELRTPLNAIMGFAEVIKDRHLGDDLARYQDYARNIHESGLHLLDVINGLLDMARTDASAEISDSEELDVAEVAASVLRMLEDRAEEAKVVLINDIVADEPQIRAERRAVRQILINLLANAIKYTPPGGAAGIESRCDGETSLALTVWDTVVGIAPEDQEKVFERSYRVSSPGEGSRMTLWLPLAEAPQDAAERAGQDTPSAS
jgi:signal transduction histidine kinase